MHQPADNSLAPRKLPVPVKRKSERVLTREEIEDAAKYYVWDADMFSNCYPADDYHFDATSYITAAFRCSFGNQAYIFMDNEYMLLDYNSTMLDGSVLDGPKIINKGIPALAGTRLAGGIYCAFGLHNRNQAFISSGNTCALISYAPDSSDFKILEGPMLINRMFPCLRGTAFEYGPNAAFESTRDNEAYLLMGNEYAVINYQDRCLISDKQSFNCLKDTVFKGEIDAAFASHVAGEAFVFKDDSFALINFVADCIIGGVKNFSDHCPTLRHIFPRENNCTRDDEPDFVIYAIDSDEYDEDCYDPSLIPM